MRFWPALFLGLCAVPAVDAACVPDGQVVVRTSASQQICAQSPHHNPNAACCSGKATPVYNASSPLEKKCEFICDPTDHCIGVVCTALDGCHDVGTCDSTTGLCSNPPRPDGSACEDGNTCTMGDTCTAGTCTPGPGSPGCCGNGVLDAGEECDDGNQQGNDGCRPSCTLDPFWECSGQPSHCCPGAGAFRFTVANLPQLQCEEITSSADPACCDGVHEGQWTGTTCNVVCAVDLCTRNNVVCQPKDACHLPGICDPSTGVCSDPPGPAGAACGDPGVTACSGPDRCDAQGDCVPNDAPAGSPCPTASQCKMAQCNGSGGCVDVAAVADGQGCNDASLCTTGDHCVSGQCAGTAVTCQPSDGCHVATCDPQSGCASAPAPAGTPCGTGPGGCTSRCDAAGTCQPCSTSTTIPGPTTTTLPLEAQCDGLLGLARAACRIRAALAAGLCGDERIPTRLDKVLRHRLDRAARQLEAAATSDGHKRARLLRRVRGALTAIEHQAAGAAKSKSAAKRISSSCQDELGGLVGTTRADLS